MKRGGVACSVRKNPQEVSYEATKTTKTFFCPRPRFFGFFFYVIRTCDVCSYVSEEWKCKLLPVASVATKREKERKRERESARNFVRTTSKLINSFGRCCGHRNKVPRG